MAEKNNNSRVVSFKGEFFRKLTHVGALIIPGGYYILALDKTEALLVMIPAAVAMIIIDIGRLRGWKLWNLLKGVIGVMIRDHEEKGDFTGATYILVTACLVIAIYPKPVAVAALAFIIVGDPVAVMVGQNYGKHFYGHRTFEGSLGFLAAASLVALVAPDLPLAVGLIGAFAATVTEAVSFKIDDNATVPLVSGLVMYLHLLLGRF